MGLSSLRNDLFLVKKTGPLPKTITTDTDTEFDDQHTSSLIQPILYSSDEKRSRTCKIRVKLHTCVHGYLAPDERKAASLVVFSVSLNCSKRRRSFSSFKIDVEFFDSHTLGSISEKYSGSLQTKGPAVLRYAPKSVNSNERTADVEKKKTRNISANAEANLKVGGKGAGTGVNLGGTGGTAETYKHHYFETCRSNTRGRLPYSDVPVAVEWNLLENNQPSAKNDAGLTPEFLFAILLQRRDNEKFGARLSLEADAGKRNVCGKYLENVDFSVGIVDGAQKMVEYAMKLGTETVTREFDPEGSKYQGDFSGIQRNNLGRFANSGALHKLTELHS